MAQSKGKPTSRSAATRRMAERTNAGPRPKVGTSSKQRDQRRIPKETPLTGEDRPGDREGGKSQRTARGREAR